MQKRRDSLVPIALGLGFAVEVVALGWAPYDREAWLLENLISVPVAVWLVLARRRGRPVDVVVVFDFRLYRFA